MGRRNSAIIDIEPEEIDPEQVQDSILEQQELEDFEGTEVNEGEFTERL